MTPRRTIAMLNGSPLASLVRFLPIAAVVAAVFVPLSPSAATNTGGVNVSVTISAAARLSLGSSTITFPNADPDTIPSIPASEGAITVTAKAKTSTGATVSLTVRAATDLLSGSDAIPAANVRWTASGAGFVAGTMNTSSEQTVASWTGSGSRSGTQSYALTNSWSYPTGVFATTATYTLTAP